MVGRFIARLARSRVLVGVVSGLVVVLGTVAGPVAWAAMTATTYPATTSFTGCLAASTGSVYNLKKGAAPLAACTGSDAQIKLSGGDITGITAGTGLTGGANYGVATLGVDPSWLAANATTGVSAGTGLSGGSASGPASLSIASAYQLPQSCAAGTSPEASGSNTWTCGTGLSKQFRFPAVPSTGNRVDTTFGPLDFSFTCTSSSTALNAIDVGTESGSVNIFYGQLSNSSSHDTGFDLSPGGGNPLSTISGGTGTVVWDGDNGDVITATVTWYNPLTTGGTCQFDGDFVEAG